MESLTQETSLTLDSIVAKQHGEGMRPERSRNRLFVPSRDSSAISTAISAFLSTKNCCYSLIDAEGTDEIYSDITRMVRNKSLLRTQLIVCVLEDDQHSIMYNVLSLVIDCVNKEEEVSWEEVETAMDNEVWYSCRPLIPCLKRIKKVTQVSGTHEDNDVCVFHLLAGCFIGRVRYGFDKLRPSFPCLLHSPLAVEKRLLPDLSMQITCWLRIV